MYGIHEWILFKSWESTCHHMCILHMCFRTCVFMFFLPSLVVSEPVTIQFTTGNKEQGEGEGEDDQHSTKEHRCMAHILQEQAA